MKVFLVADDSTEICFLHHDSAFEAIVKESLEGEESNDLFLSSVQSYLSPLILSILTLKEKVRDPCSSITCSNETVVVFQEHNGFLFIGMGDDCQEEEINIQLNFLHSLLSLLFGPFYNFQINPQSVSQKRRVWETISSILKHFLKVASSDQSFMFESIEQLRVNTDVAKVCTKLLKKCASKLHESIGMQTSHAFLFVDSKLLAYQQRLSSSDHLPTSNLLQIILLLGVKDNTTSHANRDKSVDMTTNDEDHHKMDCDVTTLMNIFSSDDEETTPQSPVTMSQQNSIPTNDHDHSESSESDVFSMTEDYFSHEHHDASHDQKCCQVPIFLSHVATPHVPYHLYIVPVTSNIRMAFLAKVKYSDISQVICGILYLFDKLKFSEDGLSVNGGSVTSQNLEKCFKTFHSKLKKLGGKLSIFGRKIAESWKMTGQKQLEIFLSTKNKENLSLLERCVHETERSLYILHKSIYPSFAQDKVLKVKVDLRKAQSQVQAKLGDYADYLSFKSRLNIPLTPILDSYPGLVHFAFVKRQRVPVFNEQDISFSDELFMPSINSSDNSTNKLEVYGKIKDLMFQGFMKANQALCGGSPSVQLQSGDFIFTSTMWIVKSQNEPLLLNEDDSIIGKKFLTVYSSDSYRNLLQAHLSQGISPIIYQLFCVHFMLIPDHVIKSHVTQLKRHCLNEMLSL